MSTELKIYVIHAIPILSSFANVSEVLTIALFVGAFTYSSYQLIKLITKE